MSHAKIIATCLGLSALCTAESARASGPFFYGVDDYAIEMGGAKLDANTSKCGIETLKLIHASEDRINAQVVRENLEFIPLRPGSKDSARGDEILHKGFAKSFAKIGNLLADACFEKANVFNASTRNVVESELIKLEPKILSVIRNLNKMATRPRTNAEELKENEELNQQIQGHDADSQ